MAKLKTWFVASQTEVARFFGVSLTTLTGNWVAKGCPLSKSKNGYNLQAIARWRVTQDRNGGGGQALASDEIRSVNLELKKLDLAEREKRLVDISEVTGWLGRLATVIRDAITRLDQKHGWAAADELRVPLERLEVEIKDHAPK